MENYNAMTSEARWNRTIKKLDKQIQQLRVKNIRYKKIDMVLDDVVKFGIIVTLFHALIVYFG